MPTLPTGNDLHVVDQVLTDYAIGYGQEIATSFASFRASTPWMVDDQSDRYVVWDKADWFRVEAAERGDGSRSKRGGLRMSTATYYCTPFALSTSITKKQRKRAERRGIDIERVKTRWLTEQAHRARDLQMAQNVFVTGVWTANTEQAGVAAGPTGPQFLQWDNASSTPLSDITDQMEVVRQSIGRMPNVALTSHQVIKELRQHPDFVDLFKHTTGGLPTEAKVAEALGLEAIIVGGSVQNTATEGQTESMADIFGKNFLIMYVDPEPSEERPTAVTSFSWSDFDGMTESGATINSWYEPDTQSDILETEFCVDHKITANDAGVMMLTAVA